MYHINSERHRDCVGCGLLLSAALAPNPRVCTQCGDVTCARCTLCCDICRTAQVCVNCMLECTHVFHKGDSRICPDCARHCSHCHKVVCCVCERHNVHERATCTHCHGYTPGMCPLRVHKCTLCRQRGCSACVFFCHLTPPGESCHTHTAHLTCASLSVCAGCTTPLAACTHCVASCGRCHQPVCDACASGTDHCADCQCHVDPRRRRTCTDCQQPLCSACGRELLEPGMYSCPRCLAECRLCGGTVRRRLMATGRFQDVCAHCADYMTHTLTERMRQDIVHATGWPVCVASMVLLFLEVNGAFVERHSK